MQNILRGLIEFIFNTIKSNLSSWLHLHQQLVAMQRNTHTHTQTHSVPQSLIRALPLGIISVCWTAATKPPSLEVPEYRLGLPSPFSRTPLAGKCQALTSRFYGPWLWPSLCWKVSDSGRSFPVWPSARREGLGFHHRACDWYPHEERDCFYRAFTIRVRSTRCTFGWDSTSAHGEIPLFGACRCNHWFGDCNC